MATKHKIHHNISNNIHKSHGLTALISKNFINDPLVNKDDMRNLNLIDNLVSFFVATTKWIVRILEQPTDVVLVR